MEVIINTQSSRSLSSTPRSDNLAFIDDTPLFAPSPSPSSHMSWSLTPSPNQVIIRSPTPPHNEVVPETAAPSAAIVSPVIVALDDDILMQEGTPEPEMVPITSGRRQGQLRKKKGFVYRGMSVLLTYPNLEAKATMAALRTEFAKNGYRFRELVRCFERHKATRDANGEVLVEGKWHMHILGHLRPNSKGDAPNIKNEQAFDITLGRNVCQANIQPPRNHTNV